MFLSGCFCFFLSFIYIHEAEKEFICKFDLEVISELFPCSCFLRVFSYDNTF